jgi:hypothetical protein
MNVCRKCGEQIDNGLTLCAGHYKSAKAQYKSDLANYKVAIEKWEAMTPEERSAAHSAAETFAVKNYAGEVGAILGLSIWYYLHTRIKIDGLVGFLILVASTAIFSSIRPLASAAGKTARALLRGLIYFAILLVLSIGLAFISEFIKKYLAEIWALLAIIAFVSAMLGEAKGEHAASATPVKPAKPKP